MVVSEHRQVEAQTTEERVSFSLGSDQRLRLPPLRQGCPLHAAFIFYQTPHRRAVPTS